MKTHATSNARPSNLAIHILESHVVKAHIIYNWCNQTTTKASRKMRGFDNGCVKK
jgi:hypothetical protein